MSSAPSQELLPRFKKDVACLSAWAISQLAVRPASENDGEETTAHLATCTTCAQHLAKEQEAVVKARHEPIPAFIAAAQSKHATPRWAWWGFGSLSLVVATAAALLFFVVPRGEPGVVLREAQTRTKGKFPVVVTVMRDGHLVTNDVPLEEVVVQASDRLRLRVSAGEKAWVIVEGFSDGWEQYFAGTNPQDWLPIAIEVTEEGKTRLRIQVCQSYPSGNNLDPEACEYQIFDL